MEKAFTFLYGGFCNGLNEIQLFLCTPQFSQCNLVNYSPTYRHMPTLSWPEYLSKAHSLYQLHLYGLMQFALTQFYYANLDILN